MICPTCRGGRTLLKKVKGKGCYEVVLGICDKCNGTGEIKATNFQRITASPEALAEWLTEHCDYCSSIQHWQCDKCPHSKTDCTDAEAVWSDWLRRESDAE